MEWPDNSCTNVYVVTRTDRDWDTLVAGVYGTLAAAKQQAEAIHAEKGHDLMTITYWAINGERLPGCWTLDTDSWHE